MDTTLVFGNDKKQGYIENKTYICWNLQYIMAVE